MPALLVASRQFQWHHPAPEPTRRDHDRRLSGPYSKLATFQKRMRWTFKWVSSGATDFNFDYHVSFTAEEFAQKKAFYNFKIQDPQAPEREGHSVFYKDASGAVFHTYSCYDRGNDMLNLHYHYLDLVPKGRDEGTRGPYWVQRRDEYGR